MQCNGTAAAFGIFCGLEKYFAMCGGSTHRLVFPCPEKAYLQGTRRGSGDLHDSFCRFYGMYSL